MVLAGVRSAHIPSAVPKREANRAREALGTLGVDVRAPLRGKKASEGSAAPGVDLVVLGSWDLKGARSKLKGQKGFLVVGSSFLEEWASRGEVWAGSTIRGARNRGCGALLNQTLGKLEIVLAGFKDEEREELKFLAEALGAAVSDEFKARTNVVVSSRLDSPEGQLALAARIKEDQDVVVVGRKWLDQCVEKRTLASAWDNRLCCLADMEICTTGCTQADRKRIEATVTLLGGVYAGDLRPETHILIAHKLQGEKVDFATREGIPIVQESWLRACQRTGAVGNHLQHAFPGAAPAPDGNVLMLAARARGMLAPLDSDAFVIGTRDGVGGLDSQAVLSGGDSTQVYRADSQTQPYRSDSTQPYMAPLSQPASQRGASQKGPSQSWDDAADEAGEYLDGVTVLLADDIPPAVQTPLLGLCRRGGAMTVLAHNFAVRGFTHMVTSAKTVPADLAAQVEGHGAAAVSTQWLEDCFMQKTLLPAEAYAVPFAAPAPPEPAPPRSVLVQAGPSRSGSAAAGAAKGASLRRPQTNGSNSTAPEPAPPAREPVRRSRSLGALPEEAAPARAAAPPSAGPAGAPAAPSKSIDFLAQFLGKKGSKGPVPGAGAAETAEAGPLVAQDAPAAAPQDAGAPSGAPGAAASGAVGPVPAPAPAPGAAAPGAGVFTGKLVTLAGFGPEETRALERLVRAHGGRLARKGPKSKRPDYDVRPLGQPRAPEGAAPGSPKGFGRRLVQRPLIVSEYWLRKCAATGALHRAAASPAHRPLPHALPLPPDAAAAIRVCLSGLHGPLRQLVEWLCHALGAAVQADLSKSATHLVMHVGAARRSEAKETFARGRGIPVVSPAWLEACAAAGSPAPDPARFPPALDPFAPGFFLPASAAAPPAAPAAPAAPGSAGSAGGAGGGIDAAFAAQTARSPRFVPLALRPVPSRGSGDSPVPANTPTPTPRADAGGGEEAAAAAARDALAWGVPAPGGGAQNAPKGDESHRLASASEAAGGSAEAAPPRELSLSPDAGRAKRARVAGVRALGFKLARSLSSLSRGSAGGPPRATPRFLGDEEAEAHLGPPAKEDARPPSTPRSAGAGAGAGAGAAESSVHSESAGGTPDAAAAADPAEAGGGAAEGALLGADAREAAGAAGAAGAAEDDAGDAARARRNEAANRAQLQEMMRRIAATPVVRRAGGAPTPPTAQAQRGARADERRGGWGVCASPLAARELREAGSPLAQNASLSPAGGKRRAAEEEEGEDEHRVGLASDAAAEEGRAALLRKVRARRGGAGGAQGAPAADPVEAPAPARGGPRRPRRAATR